MLRQKLYLGQGAQQELTTLSTPGQEVCFTKTSPHLLTFTTLFLLFKFWNYICISWGLYLPNTLLGCSCHFWKLALSERSQEHCQTAGAESNHTDLCGDRCASPKSLEVTGLRRLVHSHTDLNSIKHFAKSWYFKGPCPSLRCLKHPFCSYQTLWNHIFYQQNWWNRVQLLGIHRNICN